MIEVKELVKEYATLRAVDKISFDVPKGQILGFLGPNGAGKTTTMKMLTCFITPTSGTATIGGKDIRSDSLEVRAQIGYLPENAPTYSEMTVSEFLAFIAEMRGILGKEKFVAMDRIKDICFLSDVWHQPIETLSKGYCQRVGFGQALIHDPPILVLDEPTNGLDPNQKFEVRQLIRRMGKDKTIILSTHILEEVEAVCQRAIIIANGKIVADSTPNELMKQSNMHNAVTMTFSGDQQESMKSELSAIENVLHVEDLADVANTFRLFPKNGDSIVQAVSQTAKSKSWPIEQIHVERGKLEEVFRKVTSNNQQQV